MLEIYHTYVYVFNNILCVYIHIYIYIWRMKGREAQPIS